MPSPSAEVLALAERFAPGLAFDPSRGPAGASLGRSIGASLEFHDRRSYQSGDDVRHLDWRAMQRTGELLVRQYREEVLPRLDLLVDDSRSMALTPAKAAATVDLTALLALSARGAGFQVRVLRLGARAEPVDLDAFLREGLALAGTAPLAATWPEALARLAPGGLRLALSDFLTPHEAAPLVRGLASRAARIGLIQLLAPEDARPPADGAALRLVDAESGATRELARDGAAVERYLARLERLASELARECVRVAGVFTTLVADAPLAELARGPLVEAGVLVPA